jgi:hypothetical protein
MARNFDKPTNHRLIIPTQTKSMATSVGKEFGVGKGDNYPPPNPVGYVDKD